MFSCPYSINCKVGDIINSSWFLEVISRKHCKDKTNGAVFVYCFSTRLVKEEQKYTTRSLHIME